jgi:Tol biopolymer transport system component
MGTRLVVLDEHGDRVCELVQPATSPARDMSPAISPDGRWVLFASSRGRTLAETSLWIARLEPRAVARQLTEGDWIDAQPTWFPDGDGNAIAFASTRTRGNFDLFKLAIDRDGNAVGHAAQLTDADGHEITPSVAPDGTIYYTAVTPHDDGSVDSHIERLSPDGTLARVTDGPGDTSPAISPDGQMLAFARPVEHASGPDADLWLVKPAGGAPTQLVDLPLTDEGGPVWSRDGRFVFATSVLRRSDGKPVFSSVVVIDTHAAKPTARMLEDHVGAISRLTPAIASTGLDAAALDANPEYLPELARITARAIAEVQREAAVPPAAAPAEAP